MSEIKIPVDYKIGSIPDKKLVTNSNTTNIGLQSIGVQCKLSNDKIPTRISHIYKLELKFIIKIYPLNLNLDKKIWQENKIKVVHDGCPHTHVSRRSEIICKKTCYSIADAQQHCVAVIKQEARDEDDEDGEENIAPSSHNRDAATAAGFSAATLQQQKEHFLQQQEEIVNRLHKAVSDNLKLINQSKESSFSTSSSTKTTTASMTNNGNNSQQQDDVCSNRNSTSASSLNMSSLSANNSRFAMRNFNNVNTPTENMKTCRLTSKSSSSAGSKLLNVAQQLHSNISNDLFSSLIDNDDNNNNNTSNLLHEDNNSESNYLLPCPLCEIPLEPRVFRQHLDRHYPRDSPICPVLQCGRRFAHPNSVRNHMRLKHSIQWNRMKSMRSSGGPFSSIPY